ncbi:YecA family protein [Vibrio profundum]|uniref:YecA/YgfB family protein n=1 Tax=Vibrio profundum TaxID=2910247 RepID=UPI003D106634
MTNKTLPKYSVVADSLQAASISVTPAELHGLLVGMLSGGHSLTKEAWQALIFDYTNEGMGWPDLALQQANAVFEYSKRELTGTDLELNLLLADSEGEKGVFDFADSVSDWVNHFISGLGLVGATLVKASKDTKEALADLEEIAKLGLDEDDDLEEQSLLLEQVIEHVKVCVLTIHSELGIKPTDETSPTIH